MNKADLVSAVADDTGVSRSKAQEVFDSALNQIQEALQDGDKVTIVGFGTFSVRKRDARTGRNPRTGKPIKIKAKKVCRFTPGKALKDAIN